jgi:transcriptional regulator with XRE-family HTH domain
MSESSKSLRNELIQTQDDKEYRHAYAEEELNATIGTQIKVLREQRGLTQEALAREAGMKQSMICRYEDVNYSSWSISTLKKLARAFDVWLEVRFRSFADLVAATEAFSREELQVPKFAEDPYFKGLPTAAALPKAVLHPEAEGQKVVASIGAAFGIGSESQFGRAREELGNAPGLSGKPRIATPDPALTNNPSAPQFDDRLMRLATGSIEECNQWN